MTTTQSPHRPAAVPDPVTAHVVEEFLQIVAAGRGRELSRLYSAEAVSDLTVPNWRYSAAGPEAIGDVYAGWYADAGAFEELEVRPTSTGVTIDFLLTWEEGGMPFAAHHCHILDLVDGRIVRDTVFCGGRWSAALLAQMEEAARAR